jgi:phytoene synthase
VSAQAAVREAAAGPLAQRQLAAAGITRSDLQAGYEHARRLNAANGKTYYLATRLLPRAKRPYVHALYGFARYADDIVDNLDPAIDAQERAARFQAWSGQFLESLRTGESGDPITRALIDTMRRWSIPASHFADFLHSMRMDLTVTEYATYDDLVRYMWGSAAVIGLEMLPILGSAGPAQPPAGLESGAIDLGLAFQLTNFIRDISEDLARGRVYLPQDSLRACRVDRGRLEHARRAQATDQPIRDLIALEIERARALYRSAAAGIELVHPTSRDCLRTAFTLYGDILTAIEEAGYDVFSRRVSVTLRRRARVAGAGLIRAHLARSRVR